MMITLLLFSVYASLPSYNCWEVHWMLQGSSAAFYGQDIVCFVSAPGSVRYDAAITINLKEMLDSIQFATKLKEEIPQVFP